MTSSYTFHTLCISDKQQSIHSQGNELTPGQGAQKAGPWAILKTAFHKSPVYYIALSFETVERLASRLERGRER